MTTITDPRQFGRVAVLLGGDSAEREISLMSGEAVLKGLLANEVDAIGFDPAKESLTELRRNGVDRVFNALHGRAGEGGVVQGALEAMGLPYTGSGVLGSALALDKVRSKQLFTAVGLSTPAWLAVSSAAELDQVEAEIGFPCVVKPASEGSSVAVTRVDSISNLAAAWEAACSADPVVLIEQLIDGDEFTAGILGADALPLIHIETNNVFYDYDAKYVSDETQYHCPCGLPQAQETELRDQSLAAFHAVAAHGWGRVDFMLDNNGVAQFLEVNTIPGMTSHSLVPKAAAATGMSFEQLVWRILELTLAEGGQ
ncbi:MAG: D-alanine--D-alanine ligase [Gammaproteobacteria bacterium]|nr:D-alanine--D-alanine ligase [Gammaproteobacteria bacterium]